MTADLTWLKEGWPSASFNDKEGRYRFEVADGITAHLRPLVFWDQLGPKLQLEDTKWQLSFSDGNFEVMHLVDLHTYLMPYWWAHGQPSNEYYYTREHCFDVADFMLGIWTNVYMTNIKGFGPYVAAWLAGFNITERQ